MDDEQILATRFDEKDPRARLTNEVVRAVFYKLLEKYPISTGRYHRLVLKDLYIATYRVLLENEPKSPV